MCISLPLQLTLFSFLSHRQIFPGWLRQIAALPESGFARAFFSFFPFLALLTRVFPLLCCLVPALDGGLHMSEDSVQSVGFLCKAVFNELVLYKLSIWALLKLIRINKLQ